MKVNKSNGNLDLTSFSSFPSQFDKRANGTTHQTPHLMMIVCPIDDDFKDVDDDDDGDGDDEDGDQVGHPTAGLKLLGHIVDSTIGKE